ncbi:MAG: TIGR04282 family arsenosugar biosynthesis glycosyltransferase [Pseudomonadales bacterium]
MDENTLENSGDVQNRILIFARAPRLGRVKTRLNKALPPDKVLDLHKRLLKHALANVMKVSGVQVELWVDENPSDLFFEQLQTEFPEISIYLQAPGDLGAKMLHALSQSVDERQASVIIGSDCPAIDSYYIQASLNALEDQDLVIGPASDGGYVLIGTKHKSLPVFDGIDWGTEQVLQQTLQIAVQSDFRVRLMAELNDVDEPYDLGEAHRFGLLDV